MANYPGDVPEEMLLGQFIPLHYHFNMLLDQNRMLPFKEAISMVVPTNGKVLELGGGTGVLSWFAAQKASHVWCVERNPALVKAARSFLQKNENGDRVTVVQADAMTYLPPEPVDVVICEMLHVGLVREKQLQVISTFKERYRKAFGDTLPIFIPDTSLLLFQPICRDYCFSGYHAPVPIFEATGPHMQGRWLADPYSYSTITYADDISLDFDVSAQVVIRNPGHLNAISLLTNNFLAFDLIAGRAAQWMMNQLILPLPVPMDVVAGDRVEIRFAYQAGCPLELLTESVTADICSHALPTMFKADPEQRRSA